MLRQQHQTHQNIKQLLSDGRVSAQVPSRRVEFDQLQKSYEHPLNE